MGRANIIFSDLGKTVDQLETVGTTSVNRSMLNHNKFDLATFNRNKFLPSPGFEPGSPRPQSKSDNLDRSAIGPTLARRL